MKKLYILEKINNTNQIKKKSRKDFSLTKTGNLIRETRISKNLSINDLASILKISVQQLQAIEDGREDLLPEKVFIRAMVKRISEKLKLDDQLIMEEVNEKEEEEEDTQTEEIKETDESQITPEKIEKQNPFFFISVVVISGLIGLGASSFVLNKMAEDVNESNTQELIK